MPLVGKLLFSVRLSCVALIVPSLLACGDVPVVQPPVVDADAGPPLDAGEPDAGAEVDAGESPVDAGDVDAGDEEIDAGVDEPDAGVDEPDAGVDEPDAGVDEPDAGVDEPDAGVDEPDAGVDEPDAGVDEPDAGVSDVSCATDADCDDLNPCVQDTCEILDGEERGRCVYTEADATTRCNDGDACTTEDRCVSGACAGVAVACDGPCQSGACDDSGACVPVEDGVACNDGDGATMGDACQGGVCVGSYECVADVPDTECTYSLYHYDIETGEKTCTHGYYDGRPCTPDDDPCTRDVCNGTAECAHLPMPAGSECEHACGSGVCGADGACELVTSTCGSLSDSCGSGVCEDDACVYQASDPTCLASGVECVYGHDFCVGSSCGDGWCDDSEVGTVCEDCQGACDLGCTFRCDRAYREFAWRGAWRAHQSVAYNFAHLFAQQTETFTQMLDDGLRWLHVVADYCQPGAESGPICLCADDDSCALDSTPLDARLNEIKTWMDAHPMAVVTLYFEPEFVHDDDLKAAFETAGLSDMLYRRRPTFDEPWNLSVRNMAQMNRRLVVIGGPYISPGAVFLTTDGDGSVDDGVGDDFVFDLGQDRVWACESKGRSPTGGLGAAPLYVVRHVLPGSVDAGFTDWVAAGCYNTMLNTHMHQCLERYPSLGSITVALTQFYNSASRTTASTVIAEDLLLIENPTCTGITTYADQCPSDVTPCSSDDDCESGTCGLFGACLACETDDDCVANQHCNTLWNACLADLADGAVCSRDAVCRSGDCDVLCHSCAEHADCDEGEWCDVFGGCQPQNANGYACVTDVECASGSCWLGFCADCNAQEDCSGDQFCSLSPAPGESACIDRKDNGALCANDFECGSGACHLGTCQPCNGHDDCASGEYCSLPVIPGAVSECLPKKPFGGACLSSVECTSSFCLGSVGKCSTPCASDGECSAGRYCDLTFSGCAPKVDVGGACVENRVCTTGDCYLGFCVACNEHGDCNGSSQFCSLDPLPGASQCVAKKGFGSACANPVECASGRCDVTCVDCTAVPQAGCDFGNQYCEFGRCHNKGNVGASCSFSDQCKSGICDAGQCAQCTNVPQQGCDFGAQFCEARFCHDKRNVGGSCSFSDQCKSGICDLGKCVQCTNVPQQGCDFGSQYCEFGACHDKKDNGSGCGFSDQCDSGICDLGECVCSNVPRTGCDFGRQYCEFGDCHWKRNAGEGCAFSDQCKSNNCSWFVCQ